MTQQADELPPWRRLLNEKQQEAWLEAQAEDISDDPWDYALHVMDQLTEEQVRIMLAEEKTAEDGMGYEGDERLVD